MSTRGSRLEARNQREPVAQEARVKSWEKRWVDGAEKNKTKFYKWMPVIDAKGVDVESRARGAAGSRYEVIPTPVAMDADDA